MHLTWECWGTQKAVGSEWGQGTGRFLSRFTLRCHQGANGVCGRKGHRVASLANPKIGGESWNDSILSAAEKYSLLKSSIWCDIGPLARGHQVTVRPELPTMS